MDGITFENVRCFKSDQEIPIKPVTILVGENSTGKSTFLALTRIAHDLLDRITLLDFNEEPFLLGSFDQIATYIGGKSGRAKQFTIGGLFPAPKIIREMQEDGSSPLVRIKGSFSSSYAEPILSTWELTYGSRKFSFDVTDEGKSLFFKSSTSSVKLFGALGFFGFNPKSLLSTLPFILENKMLKLEGKLSQIDKKFFLGFSDLLIRLVSQRPYVACPLF
ncbi:AAA family ATPase [Candidatus Acetothermia bacterium]|nr:AAA family ATPase [Candidatus Acetothermia bacterium]